MKDYLAKSGRAAMPDQKKLLGFLKAKKVLLYTPLLKWYFEHGFEITAVHRTIDYIPRKMTYTKDEDVVDRHLRSAYFEDLEETGDAYKIESRKKRCQDKPTLPGRHRGISAGQVANVAVLL